MTGGLPHRFWGSTFLLTNNFKKGLLTMLCWFVVPSCGTHKETEGSLRDFLTADIYQNRVNLKLEITGHWEADTLMGVIHQCAKLTCVNYPTDIDLEKVNCLFANREEKSLCHVVMVAKFLDDNKPMKSIRTISNFTYLIQFHLIWQILAKFCLGPYLSLSKFRKGKRQILCCVHLLHKVGS